MAIPHAHVGIGRKGKAGPHADYILREGKYAEYAEPMARRIGSLNLRCPVSSTGSNDLPLSESGLRTN